MPYGSAIVCSRRAEVIARTLPEGYKCVGTRGCGYTFMEILIEGDGIPEPKNGDAFSPISVVMSREWVAGQYKYWAHFEHNPGFQWSVVDPEIDDGFW